MPTVGEILVRVGIVSDNLEQQASSVANSFDKLGGRLQKMGAKISTHVSLPIAGMLGVVGKLGMDFDKAMTESLAIMENVSGSMRKQMEETAFAVAKSTKFSATEAATAYYDLASAGLEAGEAMGSLQTVANFAQAGVMSLAVAGEYLAGATTAVGDAALGTSGKVDGMAKMADVLTMANNAALGTVEDFAKALSTRAGGAIRQYGLTVEQGVSALMAFAAQNVRGQRAGEQMYIALRDIQRASQKSSETWKKYGIDVYNTYGQLRGMGEILEDITRFTKDMSAQQRFAAISLLGFQERSKGAIQTLLGMSDHIHKFEGALKRAGGEAQRVAQSQMEALRNQLDRIMHSLGVLAIRLFNEFVPLITNSLIPALDRAVLKLEEWVKWFGQLPDWIKKATLGTATFLAVLGPAVFMLGSFIRVGGMIIATMGPAIGLIGKMASTMYMLSQGVTAAKIAWIAYGNTTSGITLAQAASNVHIMQNSRNMALWGSQSVATMQMVKGASATVSTSILGLGSSTQVASTGFRALATRVSAMAGPWGIAAAAIGTAAYALYSWKTGTSEAEDAIRDNMKAVLESDSSLAAHLSTYTKLRDKLKLTTGETNDLKAATEALTAATGLSAEGLRSETIRSDELTRSLQRQMTERWKIAEAVKDENNQKAMPIRGQIQEEMKRIAEMEANLRNIRNNGNLTVSRRLGEPIEKARIRNIKMIENQLDSALKKVDALDAQLNKLGMPRLGRDISLPTIVPPVDDPIPTTTGDLTGLTPPGKDSSASEYIRTRQSLLTKFLLDIYDMNEALHEAFNQNVPESLIFKEWGDDLVRLQDRANAWGHTFEGMMAKMAGSATQRDLVKTMQFGPFDPKGGMIQLGQNDIDWMHGITTAREKEYNKLTQMTRKNNAVVAQSYRSRQDEVLASLEDERQAEIENTVLIHSVNSEAYARAKTSINDKYDFLRRKALGTYDTLEARMRDLNIFTREEMSATASEAARDYEQMKKSGLFTVEALQKGLIRLVDSQKALGGRFLASWREPLAGLTQRFQQLVQSSELGADSFVRFVSDMGGAAVSAIAASDALGEGIFKVKDAFGDLKNGIKGAGMLMKAGVLSLATGMMEGVGALMQATSSASLSKNLFGGAMSGAMLGAGTAIGASVLAGVKTGLATAGVWGAVAGAIVGIMIGYMRGRAVRQLMKSVGSEWGVDISKGLAETIRADSREFGDVVAASIYNMKKIIEESKGGIAGNFDLGLGKMRDTFTMVERGIFTTADAAHVLDENFGGFVAHFLTLDRIAPPVLSEIIRLNEVLGVRSAAVLDVLKAQTSAFGTAVVGMVAVTSKKYGTLKSDIEEASKAAKDAAAALDTYDKTRRDTGDEPDTEAAKLQEDVDKTKAALSALLTKQEEGAKAAGDELARMGRLALAGFVAAEAGGLGIIASLDAVGPALDELIKLYDDLGMSMEGTAAQSLLDFRHLVNENRELVNSVDALNTAMVAASIIGALNADTLADMEVQGLQTFQSLLDAGFTEMQSLKMMAGWLQKVYDAHDQLGVPIDENTGKLIAQGIELGVIKTDQLSMNEILMDGLAALITALGGTVPAAWKRMTDTAALGLGNIRNEAQDLVDGIADTLSNTTFDIHYRFTQQGDSPRTPDGGDYLDVNVPHLATGGIVYGPTLAMIGEREAEVVRPLRDDIHQNARAGSSVTHLYMDGRRVGGSIVKRHAPQVLMNHGVRRR
jgi:TP901 family phage tail tape measure protein